MKNKDIMTNLLDEWDASIFFHGGDTSNVGYTDEQYKLLNYKDKSDFQTDDFFEEFNFENRVQGMNIGKGLSKADKHNLKEYSHLFKGIEDETKRRKYMLGLALHLNRYRYLYTRDAILWKLNKKNRLKLLNKKNRLKGLKGEKNYTDEERAEALKNKATKAKKTIETFTKLINEIRDLMGGKGLSHGDTTDALNKCFELFEYDKSLSTALDQIENYPHKFVPRGYKKVSIPKENIKNYLVNLKLKGKSIDIENFINDIDNTEIKQNEIQ